jgi:hypothetical protein
MDEMESAAKKLARGLKRQLAALCPDPRVVAFVDDTTGLGSACHFFLGLLPNWIADFQTVSKLWAYCGLHVVDGRAPKREKGRRANWSSRLKSIAIVYLAEPCMKHRASPYRGVYELRRAHTAEMHPSPDPESCEACQKAAKETRHRKKQGKTGSLDCARYGGPHWTDGHAHKDALRVTAKAIVKDLWRVSRGQDPLFGGATRLAAPPILRLEPAGQRSTSRETIAPSLSKATPNPGTQPTVATTPMPNYQGLREATDNP